MIHFSVSTKLAFLVIFILFFIFLLILHLWSYLILAIHKYKKKLLLLMFGVKILNIINIRDKKSFLHLYYCINRNLTQRNEGESSACNEGDSGVETVE